MKCPTNTDKIWRSGTHYTGVVEQVCGRSFINTLLRLSSHIYCCSKVLMFFKEDSYPSLHLFDEIQ